MEPTEIQDKVKAYIRENHVPDGEKELTEATPLISGGVLNSLSTLELVTFLEETFDVEIAAHEVGVHNLDTLESIARFVQSKQ